MRPGTTRTRLSLLLLPMTAAVAVAVSAGACSGGDGADGACTPPPATDLSVTVQGEEMTAYAGRPVAMRLVLPLGTANTTVFTCSSSLVAAD